MQTIRNGITQPQYVTWCYETGACSCKLPFSSKETLIMDLNSLTAFFDTYKLAIISFVVMVLLAFVSIRLTLSLRVSAEKELAQLQYTNPALYAERLQKTAG